MEGTIGEIRLFAGNFAPRNWAFCDGKLVATSLYPALFTVIGNNYGGDGVTNFRLPDLRGRTIIHPDGPYALGHVGGEVEHLISLQEMPRHDHVASIQGSTILGNSNIPLGRYLGSTDTGSLPAIYSTTTNIVMNEITVQFRDVGGGIPHNNMQPYLGLNYIICLLGLFPAKN